MGRQEGHWPHVGEPGSFSLCCSLILKPPVVSVTVRINTVLKGTRAGPACLPFCAPATTASLSQPAIHAHPRGLCSHQCPAGGSSPDTCMLDALMPLRCGSSITSSPVCPHKTTPSFPALLLLFLRRTHMPHILFICSSSTTTYAPEGGILPVLFTNYCFARTQKSSWPSSK